MFKYVFLGIIAATVYFVYFLEVQFTNQMIGRLFVSGIGACFIAFGIFKFGLHYKIASVGRFATAFYYAAFEYKKVQTEPSDLNYVDSVRQQAEVALAANFDPTLSAHQMAIPVTLYSGKDPYLEELRAKIKEAEKLKLQSHQLDAKANILLDKTQDDLVEKNLITGQQPKLFDRWFDMVEGTEAIIELTTNEVKEQGYGNAPDYEMISRIALDRNPFFSTTYRFFDSEAIAGILSRAPFMIILVGIIGTFAGFYLALAQGGDIKAGAAVAIISSLVGLPTALLMEYINTLFPDQERYQRGFNTYKVALEILFNHEQELSSIRKDRRQEDKLPGSYSPGDSDSSQYKGPN
ncbi:MAG: hypothetical protein WBO58_10045 [Gammaproteobacteria bacterium]